MRAQLGQFRFEGSGLLHHKALEGSKGGYR